MFPKISIKIFCFFTLFTNSIISQEMPLDFSDTADIFTGFSGSGFAFNIDPEDSNNQVGQFFNDGLEEWQGFIINLIRSIDMDFQQEITLSFYGFDPNEHTILLKLENGVNPDVQVTATIPAGGGWTENVSFDFSNAVLSSDGQTPINASGTYDGLSIFIDGGLTIPGTYLIDNIDDGSEGFDNDEIDVEYTYLVWADEFDIPGTVNSENWHHQTQILIPGVGWANGEEQHYTDRLDNSFVDTDGYLNIVAKRENYTDQGLTKAYTSARLNSKFAFTYGRVDIRAKFPIDDGTWPALWMLGKNINEDGGYWDSIYGTTSWPACGEIDIMEHGIFPNEDINYINSAIHTPCCNGGNPNQGGIIAEDLENEFHIYSMNWSPNQITFLLDGEGFYTYNPAIKDPSTWPFIEDQYLLLNVAMGGLAGAVDPNFNEGTMLIDYVRVYQEEPLTISENSLEKSIQIYPNPVADKLYISSKHQITQLDLYDVFGKHMLSKQNDFNTLDTQKYPSGVYFIKLSFPQGNIVKKLIIK